MKQLHDLGVRIRALLGIPTRVEEFSEEIAVLQRRMDEAEGGSAAVLESVRGYRADLSALSAQSAALEEIFQRFMTDANRWNENVAAACGGLNARTDDLAAACGGLNARTDDLAAACEDASKSLVGLSAQLATLQRDLISAYSRLAQVRMPGLDYIGYLRLLHEAIGPRYYVEIGVATGASLVLAQSPTCAIGVDPEPQLTVEFQTETHIYSETSDSFFEHRRLEQLLGDQAFDLAFVDGLHHFEQVLKDFAGLEAFATSRSVIALHDTVPLDEPTQRRDRETTFWTGDVWKSVLCLKEYRPDLEIFTVAASPTGLTIVTGLDASSRVLRDAFDEAVARYMRMPFSAVEYRLYEALNVEAQSWEEVESRLANRGILHRSRN